MDFLNLANEHLKNVNFGTQDMSYTERTKNTLNVQDAKKVGGISEPKKTKGFFDEAMDYLSWKADFDNTKQPTGFSENIKRMSPKSKEIIIPTLYSEASNNFQNKGDEGIKELYSELDSIMSTAFNRENYRKKEGKKNSSLDEILTEPNQYQGYDPLNPKSEYNVALKKDKNFLEQQKYNIIKEYVDKQLPLLKDRINGNQFYYHYEEPETGKQVIKTANNYEEGSNYVRSKESKKTKKK